MKCKVRTAAQQYGMLRRGEVLLGLSGGADSMSLLHILYDLQSEYGFCLSAAHVNHGLRGAQADRDEAFVRDACAKLGIPLHVLHADVAAQAACSGEGIEACGRRIRYAYFRSLTDGEVATAHTADDNAETVLLHLTRGSGLSGLCGIPPVRDGIIRPLIACTRADVEDYCREHSIEYVTDSSNLSDDYARNRIRHHVIPTLRELNPAFSASVLRCGEILRSEDAFLQSQADALLRQAQTPFGWSRKILCAAPPALQDRVLHRILQMYTGSAPAFQHIRQCSSILHRSGKAQISQTVTLCAFADTLYPDRPPRASWIAPIEGGTAVLPFGTAKIQIELAENIQNIYKQDLTNCLCCDTIYGTLFFRSRLPGDAMTRANSGCRKSFKKLMEEQGVPAPFRSDVPILTDGNRILWAEGVGCDQSFQITEASVRILRIQILREDYHA